MRIVLRDKSYFNKLIIMKGLNKKDFANEIGVSHQFTVQISNGSRSPSPRIAKNICEVLEVEFDKIFIIKPMQRG